MYYIYTYIYYIYYIYGGFDLVDVDGVGSGREDQGRPDGLGAPLYSNTLDIVCIVYTAYIYTIHTTCITYTRIYTICTTTYIRIHTKYTNIYTYIYYVYYMYNTYTYIYYMHYIRIYTTCTQTLWTLMEWEADEKMRGAFMALA